MENIIEIKNLNFFHGKTQILKNIDLKIKKNRFLGILGPNGSGKSTLIKTILAYFKTENNKIKIMGNCVNNLDSLELAKTIGYIPQKSNIRNNLTVKDIVLLGRLPHLKSKWNGFNKKDYEICNHVMDRLDITRFKDRSGLSLSGGEFQKVMMARAMVQQPKILLMDEPTSALDINHALELMNLAEKIKNNRGVTTVAVLHDLNLAALYCEDIVFLKDGELKYYGTPKELYKKEIIKEIYNLDCKIVYTEHGDPYIMPCKGDNIVTENLNEIKRVG